MLPPVPTVLCVTSALSLSLSAATTMLPNCTICLLWHPHLDWPLRTTGLRANPFPKVTDPSGSKNLHCTYLVLLQLYDSLSATTTMLPNCTICLLWHPHLDWPLRTTGLRANPFPKVTDPSGSKNLHCTYLVLLQLYDSLSATTTMLPNCTICLLWHPHLDWPLRTTGLRANPFPKVTDPSGSKNLQCTYLNYLCYLYVTSSSHRLVCHISSITIFIGRNNNAAKLYHLSIVAPPFWIDVIFNANNLQCTHLDPSGSKNLHCTYLVLLQLYDSLSATTTMLPNCTICLLWHPHLDWPLQTTVRQTQP